MLPNLFMEPSAKKNGSDDRGGLQMAPDVMLDLARKAAEILVDRIDGLPADNAWDGDFQQALDAKLKEDPPENGRPGR